MHTVLDSVKNSSEHVRPSRPCPDAFMPPNGTFKSRCIHVFTQTVPTLILDATECARDKSCVHNEHESPYCVALAYDTASASVLNGVTVTTLVKSIYRPKYFFLLHAGLGGVKPGDDCRTHKVSAHSVHFPASDYIPAL
jgi:hypothetical protein